MPTTDEFEQRVQKKAEQHLDACHEAQYAQDEGEDMESPSYGPFCGCTTCVVREVLSVTWDEMLAEAKAEVEAREEGARG